MTTAVPRSPSLTPTRLLTPRAAVLLTALALALLTACGQEGAHATSSKAAAADSPNKKAEKSGVQQASKVGTAAPIATHKPAGPMQPRPPLPGAKPAPTGTFFGLGAINPDKDKRKHHFYPGPKPPPRVGEVIKIPVPAPGPAPSKGAPIVANAGPLKVSRVAPNGTVGVINAVTAQFNRPMVPVGSLSDLKKWPVPLVVRPALKATPRWLGTKTVVLETKGRVAFSTLFTAEVPTGTKSADGGTMKEAKQWTFETPRLRIQWRLPTGSQVRPETAVAITFNQDIVAEKVAARLQMRRGGNLIKLALVPQKAWKTLPKLATRLAGANAKRTVVLRPTKLLPRDTSFSMILPTGSYSAEGPLPSAKALTWGFSTYPKLKIQRAWCEYRDKRKSCREGNPINVRTSTTLASAQDLQNLIEVTPKPADLQINASGRGLSITGGFEASRTYKVRISGKLRDVFGQALGKRWQSTFSYRDGEPVLQLPSTRPVVLEQAAGAKVHARVRNLSDVTLHLLPIHKGGLHEVHRRFGRAWYPQKEHPYTYLRRHMSKSGAVSQGMGKAISRRIKTKTAKNKLGIVPLNLKPGLAGKRSGVVAVTVAADWPYNKGWFSSKTGYASLLVQVTNIGITARWDKKRVVAYVATLSTGKPLPNAAVELIDGQGKTLHQGTTDDHGALEMPCSKWGYRQSRFLWVESGKGDSKQVGFMRLTHRVSGPRAQPTLRSFVWTDRNPYKPSEVAELSGLLRTEDHGMTGGISGIKSARTLNWKLRSARGIEVLKGETEIGPGGSFHVNLPLPADMDLGNARFEGKIVGGRWAGKWVRHNFQVQHYRAPEFKVAAVIRAGGTQAKLLRFGGEAELEVNGRYYFGAAMGGAKAHYRLKRSETRYRPPQHTGWTFGRIQTTVWRGWGRSRNRRGQATIAQGQGTLDAEGRWLIPHQLDPTLRDAAGKAVQKDGKPARIEGPASYSMEVWVEDDARQRISARTAATVHRGGIYAGLKLSKKVVEAGKKVTLSVVAADVQGKRQATEVQVRLVRLEPRKQARRSHAPSYRRGRSWRPWSFDEVEVGRCTATTTLTPGVDKRPKAATCDLALPTAGHYRFIAQAKDDQGATTTSHIEAYAYGKKRVRWSVRDMGKVELVTDKTSYEPGETATILIKSPFPAARGLLSVERNGLLSWRLVDVPTGATAVKVKLDRGWAPNVHVNVTLFSGRTKPSASSNRGRKSGRKAHGLDPEGKPRSATGHASLAIALTDKRVAVTVKPTRDVLAPGDTLELNVETRDGTGKPLPTRLTVWAVDEGVLALLGFMTPNPLPFFHHNRSSHTAGDDLRASILVEQFAKIRGKARPKKRYKRRESKSAGGGGRGMRTRSISGLAMGAMPSPAPTMASAPAAVSEEAEADNDGAPRDVGGGGPAPALRQLFAATAFFRGGLQTDANGKTTVKVKLPDNTTTFRVMVVAEAGEDRFGSGDGQFTTRQPVLLRAALPRFANLHDDFDAAAVLHNETGSKQTFVVGARAAGVSWHDTFEKTVTLDSGASTEVRFRVRAIKTGRATFQFAARVKNSKRRDYADAVQKSIPINLPATLEAFATYGSTTSSVKQPIQAPTDAIPGFGGLNITLSSTALSGLEDATRYLVEYPYECAEQTASRLIPITMLGELLDQFNIGGVADRAERTALVKRAVKRLVGLQSYDGGFKFWPKARRSSRWVSPWVTFSLLLAKEQGADVPARTLQRANRFLRNTVRRSYWNTSWWRVSDTLSLWVLTHPVNKSKGNFKEFERPFNRLYKERTKLPMFAQAWLLTVAHRMGHTSERDELIRRIDNNIVEKAGTAHIVEGKSEDLRILMHSSDRTDAMVLGALVEVQPKHAVMSKLIRGLMDARLKGRWSTTQANAWALVAARRYFDVFEKVKPNFATQLWLGNGYLGSQKFKGRSLAKAQAHVPIDLVTQTADKDGRKAKVGPKRINKGKVSKGKVVDLVLAKKGPGRMYYRLGMRYAPKSLRLPATEQGFTVQRRYEALNPKEKDRVKLLPNGTYRIRAGTDIRVNLTVVVPTRGHYVVVDDPLPGGFEPQNPAFRTTSAAHAHKRKRSTRGWRWYSWWRWSHIEMRDDRVLLFADRLWSGVYSHSYVARATSIGRFVVPPARAEEMYAPETFGRNATTFVEIVE